MQFAANGLIAGSTYALFALGFGLIYATTRFFNFAHAAVFTWAAYFAFTFHRLCSLPAPVSVMAAVVCAAVLGGGLELAVYRRLRRRRATDVVLLLASIGAFVSLQSMISMIYGDAPRSIRTMEVRAGFEIAGARVTPTQLVTVAVTAVLLIMMVALLRFTQIGRSLRAVASDPELASIVGVDADRVTLVAVMISSALAGVAAVLVSYDLDITPGMGFKALLMGVVAVVIGGVGSLPGAVMGAFALGLAQHLGAAVLPAKWQDAIAFFLLLAFLVARPRGIGGFRSRSQET